MATVLDRLAYAVRGFNATNPGEIMEVVSADDVSVTIRRTRGNRFVEHSFPPFRALAYVVNSAVFLEPLSACHRDLVFAVTGDDAYRS